MTEEEEEARNLEISSLAGADSAKITEHAKLAQGAMDTFRGAGGLAAIAEGRLASSQFEKLARGAIPDLEAMRIPLGLASEELRRGMFPEFKAMGPNLGQAFAEATRAGSAMEAMMGSGLGAAMKAMAERSKLFSQGVQALVGEQYSPAFEILKQVPRVGYNVPKVGSIFNTLKLAQYGETIGRLNIDPAFGADFQRASRLLAEHSQQLTKQFRGVHVGAVPKFNADLSKSIGELLARSLQAQEALLDEQRVFHSVQRDASEAAKVEVQFSRRFAYFNALIMMLTFFFTIAVHFEEQVKEEGQAEADRTAMVQMREAFEDMSEQLEELQQIEEGRAAKEDAEAGREAAADAELAAIMREIAEGLREQADDTPADEDPNG